MVNNPSGASRLFSCPRQGPTSNFAPSLSRERLRVESLPGFNNVIGSSARLIGPMTSDRAAPSSLTNGALCPARCHVARTRSLASRSPSREPADSSFRRRRPPPHFPYPAGQRRVKNWPSPAWPTMGAPQIPTRRLGVGPAYLRLPAERSGTADSVATALHP